MKKSKITEILVKSEAEIRRILSETKQEIVKLKVDLVCGKLKNVSVIGEKRKLIARILTHLKKSKLQANKKGEKI